MSTKINMGHAGQAKVEIDLQALVETRMLIQASSGGGKSHTLRRLLEQSFGKIQHIVIDPEGEFSTLREQYPYVLVGPEGDTPADIRSAGLLAQKLLELNASAVCDLYELKIPQRKIWVQRFLESLMSAPKSLWRPVLVVVDEAHIFAPEGSKSEALEAMASLASQGRKREFCAVFATQRLSKLSKDVSGELQNVLIGRASQDVDVDRSAKVLGVRAKDILGFTREVRLFDPGTFYALGRAISYEPVRFQVGDTLTQKPKTGKKHTAPPPAPDAIRALLPKLSDLPAAAEKKQRTEEDLRKELSELKRQLNTVPKMEERTRAEYDDQIRILMEQIKALEAVNAIQREDLKWMTESAGNLISKIPDELQALVDYGNSVLEKTPKVDVQPVRVKVLPSLQAPDKFHTQRSFTPKPKAVSSYSAPVVSEGITGPEQRILDAIAWFNAVGVEKPNVTAVAFKARYKAGGGAFNNPKSHLRQTGMIEYGPGTLFLTDKGRQIANPPSISPSSIELHQEVLENLPGPERRLMQVILERFPNGVSVEELAALTGYSVGGGAFNNPKSRLRTLGLVDYPSQGMVRAMDYLFID